MKVKRRSKESIPLPPADIILDFLNNEPGHDLEFVKFYDDYIHSCAKVPVYLEDAPNGMMIDEDLMQEIRIAVIKSLPVLRHTIFNNVLFDRPLVVVVTTNKAQSSE